jgi:hypothetical protein
MPRDMELLRELGESRFLNTEQILALHPGGKRNFLRRLAAMYDLGYLDRPKVQGRSKLPSSHIVYSLGKQGVEAIFGDAGQYQAVLRRLREIERSLPLIAHALMISQFKVCLTLATRKRNDLTLDRWLQGYDLKYSLKGRYGENPELVPDAFFVLGHDGYEYPVFLEVDRGTMTEERFVNKLKLYWRWWREERIKDSLGFTHFRVLTVTPNETRSENLRIASKEADTNKKGSNMFLFASDKNYSISKPEAIFEPIWKSPKDDLPKTIL